MKINELSHYIDIKEILESPLPWQQFAGQTVLVTGASGMIPSYVAYTLLGLNDQLNLDINILALVRNEEKAKSIFGGLLNRTDIRLVVQDVCEPFDFDGNIDYIFHGGSAARPSAHKAAPTETIRSNLTGTFNLLDLAIAKKSKGFILMSSSEVYGNVREEADIITENQYGFIDILNPRSCYSEGKRAAETICTSFHAQYDMNCKIPRFAHIYGPGLAPDDGRVQVEFAAKVFNGQDIVMNSDGSSIRAYTYVSDAVAGMFYILLKGNEMAYNIADSNSIVSIRQLAEAFVSARPEKDLSVKINIPENNANLYNPSKFIALDDTKLRGLGWEPKVKLQEGIDRMLKYYENLY